VAQLNAMDEINIRLASASDATQLSKLRFALRSRHSGDVESEAAFLKRCELWMAEALKQSQWRCCVGEQDETLVAALWLQVVDKIPNPTSETETFAYITNFFVSESLRGKGLGSRMLNEALSWCREQNVHSVILWPTPKSRPLYHRHGFQAPENLLELSLRGSAE
jgi:GNAT superfamily N-acetyltransferase